MDSKLEVFYEKGKRALSRRNFLAGASAVGAASVIAGCSNSTPSTTTSTTTTTATAYTDLDILNFALNLEYLEAQYYLRGATGYGLIAADTGGLGTVNGGAKVPLTGNASVSAAQMQNILNEIAYDEQQHVRFLRTALGSSAVGMPTIDLTDGFSGAVTAANSVSTTYPMIPAAFNPFANFDSFIVGAFVFEDVGVTAYSGAAGLISAAGVASGYLTAAAGILAVEAYHAAYIRTYLTGQSITLGTTGTNGYMYGLYANRISVLRSTLGGGGEIQMVTSLASATVPVTPTSATVSPTSIVPCSPSGSLAYSRTTDQVMHIVYGTYSPTAGSTTPAAGVSKGGFFPNGLMGNINTTLS